MATTQKTQTRPHALSSSSINGTKVVDYDGKHIGEIKDLMVDLENGHVLYAVLSFGGFMGIGDKYFALPWRSLRVNTVDEVIEVDISEDQLKNAPGFDKDNWPETEDYSFTDRVYQHYGYEGYSTWRDRTDDGYRLRQRESHRKPMMDIVDRDRDGV